jgi:hypothetical protein
VPSQIPSGVDGLEKEGLYGNGHLMNVELK